MENIINLSKIHVENQYLACDIWTTLSALACFGEFTTPSQHTSLRMDSTSIRCNVSRLANKPRRWKSMLTHQGWFNLLLYATFTRITNCRVCNMHIYLYPTPRRHITSPSEKSRLETWPGNYMGKATPVWQLSLSHRCHQM